MRNEDASVDMLIDTQRSDASGEYLVGLRTLAGGGYYGMIPIDVIGSEARLGPFVRLYGWQNDSVL